MTRRKKTRVVLALFVIIAGLLTVAGATPTVATAKSKSSATYVWAKKGAIPVYMSPTSKSYWVSTLGSYEKVTMVYWTDCQWYTGNYRTNRWFYIWYWGNRAGWVNASYVYNQKRTTYWNRC
jgi:hypothetical protein